MANVEFSVLVTCYNEELSIDEYYRRLSSTLNSLGRTYEIIFVNDGSRDDTWRRIEAIFDRDPHVCAAVNLFKNSGQLAAITAGLAESRGEAVVLIDSDLQLMPEELPSLVAEYDKGFDLVTGYRVDRKDSLLRIVPSWLANAIMRHASRSKVRDFGCTFKIYNATLLRAFEYGPRRLFNTVEVIARMDRIAEVPVSHGRRKYGKSGWTFSKLLKFNMDNVVILLERPFQFSFLLCATVSLLFVLRLLLERFLPVSFLSLVSNGLLLNAIVLSGVLNLAFLSIMGEFAIRSFRSARSLPLYVVRQTLRKCAGVGRST